MDATPELLKRITVRPGVLGGKPIIRDMRMAVEHILGMMAAGETPQTILEQYDFLEPEDIQACMLFAYHHVAGEEVYDHVTTLPPRTANP